MSWRCHLTWVAGVCIALAAGGCGKEEEQPTEPVQNQEQLRQEAEAAERREETAALGERVGQLETAAAELAGKVEGDEPVPAAVEEQVSGLESRLTRLPGLLGELEGASGEGWQAARQRLEAALSDIEAARAAAASAVAGWESRQAEALAADGEGLSRVNPKTGLIEGLDGGQYEQYLVAAVERAQGALRRSGHYAGPVDGDLDEATMQAIGRFQEEQALQVSGVPSPMTRSRLYASES